MDLKPYRQRLTTWLSKYKYMVLILAVGFLLMFIPTNAEEATPPSVTTEQIQTEPQLQEQLSQVLSKVSGAGKVEIMLTVATGERTIYQANTFTSTKSDATEVRHEIITVSDAQRAQNGLITQIDPPTYLGAIIVCQGADSPTVRLALTEAVSKVTGLGADRISVLKMN